MPFMKKTLFIIFLIFISFQSIAQKSSYLILGDIHYDLVSDHDMSWLNSKPDDLRQVTKEYAVTTQNNWDDFVDILRHQVETVKPTVKAVIQLGDLSEGLAGSNEKAEQMAGHIVNAIDASNMSVPWIIAKGNHDITGPGALEAFQKYYVPMFRKQTDNPEIKNASYSYISGDVQFTCIDPWDKNTNMVAFLEQELSKSKAKFKFVVIHEPVIPVTERCWHTLKQDTLQRAKLLEVIARHKA